MRCRHWSRLIPCAPFHPQFSAGVLERMRGVNTAVVLSGRSLPLGFLAGLSPEQGVLDQARARVVRNRETDQPARETVDDS